MFFKLEVIVFMLKKILISLLTFNSTLLLFTAWIKYSSNNSGCASCKKGFLFLPLSDVNIALLGVASCFIMIALLVFQSKYKNFCNIALFILSSINAIIASALQFAQFQWASQICYYCVGAAVVFYIVFIILLLRYILNFLLIKSSVNTPG